MPYDPFDPTNQNVIEPYARAGTRALGNAATSLRNSATSTAQNFQRQSDLNAPNYSLIAPATGPARNRPNANVPALPANVGRGRAIAAGGNDPAGALSDLTAPFADLAARQRNRIASEPYQGLTNFALSPSVTPATQRFGGGTNPYEGSFVLDALNGPNLGGRGRAVAASGNDVFGALRDATAPIANRVASFFGGGDDSPAPDASPKTDFLEVGENEGVIRSLDSGRTVRGSNADSARVNRDFDLRKANESFARANEIRRQTIEDLARPTFDASQVTIAGGNQDGPGDALRKERLRLAKALESGPKRNFQKNFRALQELDKIAATDLGQSRVDAALAGDPFAAATFGLRQDDLALKQAEFLSAPIEFKQSAFADALAQYDDLVANSGGAADVNSLKQTLRALAAGAPNLENIYEARFSTVELADGGMVPEAGGAIEMFANGGMISPSGPPPMPAIMQQYQQYADGARQMGLTAVPFEKFASLQASTKDTIQGFADGGMVGDNDVSGKMIVDTDPNAPTDSIPAMIDGTRPAALDSGEFVIPKDVVMYYGTDKLQKMIDKVRNPQGGQTNGATQTAFGA